MNFKDEYILTKELYREGTVFSSKRKLLYVSIISGILIPVSILTELWISFLLVLIIWTHALTTFMYYNNNVNKWYSDVCKEHKSEKLDTIIEFNDKVRYIVCGKERVACTYNDIIKVRESKNLLIVVIRFENKNRILLVTKNKITKKDLKKLIVQRKGEVK